MWKIIKLVLFGLIFFVLGLVAGKINIEHHYNCLNDVQYANYLTIPYKVRCIQSGEELHDWALKNVPAYYDSICSQQCEEYIRYCYYHYYLLDNPDTTVTYEEYADSFDNF